MRWSIVPRFPFWFTGASCTVNIPLAVRTVLATVGKAQLIRNDCSQNGRFEFRIGNCHAAVCWKKESYCASM